jgi:hypothetical protein
VSCMTCRAIVDVNQQACEALNRVTSLCVPAGGQIGPRCRKTQQDLWRQVTGAPARWAPTAGRMIYFPVELRIAGSISMGGPTSCRWPRRHRAAQRGRGAALNHQPAGAGHAARRGDCPDPEGRVRLKPGAQRMFGVPAEEASGRTLDSCAFQGESKTPLPASCRACWRAKCIRDRGGAWLSEPDGPVRCAAARSAGRIHAPRVCWRIPTGSGPRRHSSVTPAMSVLYETSLEVPDQRCDESSDGADACRRPAGRADGLRVLDG